MAKMQSLPTPRVVAALILREMSTTYGKSAGGYLWAILEPLGGILMLTIVFSLALRSPPIGTSFAMFYASGLIPYFMYTTTTGKVSKSIKFSKSLLVYPRVTFFDAALARFLLNCLTQLLVAYILLTGLFLVTETPFMPDYGPIVMSIVIALLIGFGVGVFNSFLFAVLPVWQRVFQIMTRPLFLLSGVLFTYDMVPPSFQAIIWWNPLIHVTGMMRDGIYPTYRTDYISVIYPLAFAAIPLVLGLFFLRRYHKMILNDL